MVKNFMVNELVLVVIDVQQRAVPQWIIEKTSKERSVRRKMYRRSFRVRHKKVSDEIIEASYKYDQEQQFHLIRDVLEKPRGSTMGPGDFYLWQHISIANELGLITEFNNALFANGAEAAALSSIEQSLEEHSGTYVYDLQEQNATTETIKKAGDDLDHLEARLYAEQQRVSKVADADKEQERAKLREATLISYCLYAAGWIITLASSLWGED
jgi:ribosomal protein L39E